jgi:uncharacterized protein YdhG (YjbR/CyaY superfamily)
MEPPIEAYIARFPDPAQSRMKELLHQLRIWLPGATESIKYGIPTFSKPKNLLHFAAYDRHIGFYPGPSVLQSQVEAIAPFVHSKGAVQFPHDLPFPWEVVRKLVAARCLEAGLPDLTNLS